MEAKKSHLGSRYGLTDKERELLDALSRHGSLQKAAAVLSISYGTAAARLSRLRIRHDKARQLVLEYERYKLTLPVRYL